MCRLEGGTKTEIAGTLLNQLSQMDVFIHVVRCFLDENVPHPRRACDAGRDLRSMDEEFILNDQIKVERKLASLKEERQKGAGRDKAVIEQEHALFEKLLEGLQQSQPLRDLSLSADELRITSGFGFVSQKPVLVLLNVGEGQTAPALDYSHRNSRLLAIQGKLEMDIAQLPPAEAEVFLQDITSRNPVCSA